MFKPNHALKELEIRYAISSSVKARSRSSASVLSGSANRSTFVRIMQLEIVDSRVCRETVALHDYADFTKRCRDSRFFAADEAYR